MLLFLLIFASAVTATFSTEGKFGVFVSSESPKYTIYYHPKDGYLYEAQLFVNGGFEPPHRTFHRMAFHQQ